jgi:hypothetical protein
MQNVGVGDILFIILILGVIHGIMHLVALSRRRKYRSEDETDNYYPHRSLLLKTTPSSCSNNRLVL